MIGAFDATALERSYAYLDALPERLFDALIAHPSGLLEQRAAGVLEWRGALLAGEVPRPETVTWPSSALAESIGRALERLGLPRYCKGEPDLVDELLLQLLTLTHDAWSLEIRWAQEKLALLRAEEAARKRSPRMRADAAADARAKALSEEQRKMAARVALERAQQWAVARLDAEWAERVRVWSTLDEVFGQLAGLTGWGFDLSRGILRHHGWMELVRMRELLERLPQLRQLVKILGRMQMAGKESSEPTLETILERVIRGREEEVVEQVRRVPGDVRGIERSDDIHRMLPSEAAMLIHPTLRMLWHARRNERTLLAYRLEGPMARRTLRDEGEMTPVTREAPQLERGPILVCLDTSGSMSGLPELVAKAFVLEVMRLAGEERRPCWLYAFSGPGQVVQHELARTPEALPNLLDFLAASFGGGTDVGTPLQMAMDRHRTESWRKGDVLLVTDGEFDVADTLLEDLAAARQERSLRVHGVLIGSGDGSQMERFCEAMHRVTDWEALAGRVEADA